MIALASFHPDTATERPTFSMTGDIPVLSFGDDLLRLHVPGSPADQIAFLEALALCAEEACERVRLAAHEARESDVVARKPIVHETTPVPLLRLSGGDFT